MPSEAAPQTEAATFARRATEIPTELPDALSPAFAADEQKQRQWRVFVEDVAIDPGELADVVNELAGFLMAHAATAKRVEIRVSPVGQAGPTGESTP